MSFQPLLKLAIEAAFLAGDEILRVYETDFKVEWKEDHSPVTHADKNAGSIIEERLQSTGIPVLSEEGDLFPYRERKDLHQLWIVDPLDGTKEFVKRNGEFTVNIALVQENHPVIGVIYAPVSRILYYSSQGNGSFKAEGHAVLAARNSGADLSEIMKQAKQLPIQQLPDAYTIVASRSHLSAEVNARINAAKNVHSDVQLVNAGSSIKFCMVADGSAHEYPRFGPTMEWDTAAGQCIVEEAGGKVFEPVSGASLLYNREELRNGNFIVSCSSEQKF